MKKLRAAHFGIAHDHSGVTMECARKYPDVFEIVGVCEPDPGAREEFGGDQAYSGLKWISEDELLSRGDIDVVFCEGHELRSVSDAQKCVDAGLHVHLDKPGGTDINAFEKLLNDAERKGLALQMGYMYRYNPAFKKLLSIVRAGELGDITSIDGSFSILHGAKKRAWLKQFPGGMMFYIGCHIIDMILLINGMPQGVYAFNRASGWLSGDAEDSSLAVLDYPRGACTVRTNATEVNGYAKRRLLVVGTKGTVEIQPLECPTLMTVAYLSDAEGKQGQNIARGVFPGYLPGRYDDMMLEFAAIARGEKVNPYTAAYELELQKVLLEACKQEA